MPTAGKDMLRVVLGAGARNSPYSESPCSSYTKESDCTMNCIDDQGKSERHRDDGHRMYRLEGRLYFQRLHHLLLRPTGVLNRLRHRVGLAVMDVLVRVEVDQPRLLDPLLRAPDRNNPNRLYSQDHAWTMPICWPTQPRPHITP